MRIKTYFLPIIIGIFFLSACKRNAISLDFTNAKGEVPLIGNLTFRFNQPLIKDSLLNAWDSTDYVSFEPILRVLEAACVAAAPGRRGDDAQNRLRSG